MSILPINPLSTQELLSVEFDKPINNSNVTYQQIADRLESIVIKWKELSSTIDEDQGVPCIEGRYLVFNTQAEHRPCPYDCPNIIDSSYFKVVDILTKTRFSFPSLFPHLMSVHRFSDKNTKIQNIIDFFHLESGKDYKVKKEEMIVWQPASFLSYQPTISSSDFKIIENLTIKTTVIKIGITAYYFISPKEDPNNIPPIDYSNRPTRINILGLITPNTPHLFIKVHIPHDFSGRDQKHPFDTEGKERKISIEGADLNGYLQRGFHLLKANVIKSKVFLDPTDCVKPIYKTVLLDNGHHFIIEKS